MRNLLKQSLTALMITMFVITSSIPAFASDSSRRNGSRGESTEANKVASDIQNVIDSNFYEGKESLFLNVITKNARNFAQDITVSLEKASPSEVQALFSQLVEIAKTSGNQELLESVYALQNDTTKTAKEKLISLSRDNFAQGVTSQVREMLFKAGGVNNLLSDVQNKLYSKSAATITAGIIFGALALGGIIGGLAWWAINGWSILGLNWVGPVSFISGGVLLLLVAVPLLSRG